MGRSAGMEAGRADEVDEGPDGAVDWVARIGFSLAGGLLIGVLAGDGIGEVLLITVAVAAFALVWNALEDAIVERIERRGQSNGATAALWVVEAVFVGTIIGLVIAAVGESDSVGEVVVTGAVAGAVLATVRLVRRRRAG